MTPIRLDIAPLETARLTLRAPQPADYPAFRDYYASGRSVHTGGPLDEREAWRGFSSLIGHWVMRGFGMRTITARGTDAALGFCGLWYPGTWPEPEIGWTLYDGAEGKGIAFEAALAVRTHAFDALGRKTLVSYIHPENARSIALAERLGAVGDDSAARPPHAPHALVFRHPGPGVAA
ncbi:GNAT family N-acetyltransferase [Tropicimonas sp.]|uniref:GNAT family N-acetyltransferase n=1 Tax=Tropicimonas sp. TaxID=2067044 RepID=UPI003A870F07